MANNDEFWVSFDHLHSMPGTGSRPGYCHRGARQLCQRYGIDWAQAVREGGIPASRLLATGDALAIRLVGHARQQQEH